MKKPPSHYVLAAEILAIFIFHLVKIRENEKISADIAFTQTVKSAPLKKPAIENKSSFEYLLVNLIK